jgi:predicted DNA-binding protein
MEIHLPPDVQEKLDHLVAETGLAATEFVQEAVAGYLAVVVQVRKTLDGRYDDIKSGRIKLIGVRL